MNNQIFGLTIMSIALCATLAFTEQQENPATEMEKIEALIKHVEKLKDTKFIRNDTEYDAKTAAKFLRGKWDNQKSEIKTAKDFIDKAGTQSSTSGKPYMIKLKDGKQVKCSEYLSGELKKLDESPNEKQKQQAQMGSVQVWSPGSETEDPKITREKDKPPVIVYPWSRKSKKFIKAGDFNHALDEGIEWQGKIAYLSLHNHIVVVDAKTEQVIWHDYKSAFWNVLTFENLAKANEPAQWAVVLKSRRHPEYSHCYDLNSGKDLGLRGGPAPPVGVVLQPRKSWTGSAGVRKEPLHKLVGSAEEWTKLRKEIFGGQPKDIPEAAEVDFAKEMLLVLYAGESGNCHGLSPDLVVDGDKSVLVRVREATYQSSPTISESATIEEKEHPYGLVILPRRPNKPVVLEYNHQGLIGGPPFWKEEKRLTLDAAQPADAKK